MIELLRSSYLEIEALVGELTLNYNAHNITVINRVRSNVNKALAICADVVGIV